jgi:hypothetical protein
MVVNRIRLITKVMDRVVIRVAVGLGVEVRMEVGLAGGIREWRWVACEKRQKAEERNPLLLSSVFSLHLSLSITTNRKDSTTPFYSILQERQPGFLKKSPRPL